MPNDIDHSRDASDWKCHIRQLEILFIVRKSAIQKKQISAKVPCPDILIFPKHIEFLTLSDLAFIVI